MMIEIRGLCPSILWGGDGHLPQPVLPGSCNHAAWLQRTPWDLQDGCLSFLGGIPASAALAHCPGFSSRRHVRMSQSEGVSICHSKVKDTLFLWSRWLREQDPSTHKADGNQEPSRAVLASVTSRWEKEQDVAGSQSHCQ